MDDKILDKWLEAQQAPDPRADLKARILAAATPVNSAPNTAKSFSLRKQLLPIAASILAIATVSLFGFNVVDSGGANVDTAEAEVWQEAALDLGFDDIYNWVESPDS